MKELLAAIEKVRERIERYGEQLRQSEALTRYALVNPILDALGWDIGDPNQVVPEYPVKIAGKTEFADYALKWDGKALIIVEVKRLGSPLSDAAMQGVAYAVAEGIQYFVCTDGDVWEVYDTSLTKPLKERCILKVRINDKQSDKSGGVAARKLLALWRPAMPKVEEGEEPIVKRRREDKDEDKVPEVIKQLLREHTYPKWGASRLLRETLIKCGMHWKQAGKVADKFRDQLELRKPPTDDDLKRFWHAVKEVYEKHSQQLSGVNLEGFERQMEEVAKEEHFRFKQRKERQTS
jgi:hypothetical protein